MKFTDGNWLIREGFTLSTAVQAHDFTIADNKLTAYASTRPIQGRANTINGQLLTIQFHSRYQASSA